jgi:hypothetical protein
MKKLLGILLILGIIEIFYGILWGQLQIYRYEMPMIHDLELPPSHYKIFGEYITRFKDQWRVVAIFGVVHMIIFFLMLRLNAKKEIERN